MKKLTDYKWLNLFRTEWEGKEWIFASRKDIPSVKPDAVMIVPFHKDGLVVIKEERAAIAASEWTFPAGLLESENIEEEARRELKEETNLDLTEVLFYSPTLISSAGMSDESLILSYVKCDGKLDFSGNKQGEKITGEIISKDRAAELVFSKELFSAKAWPIILSYSGIINAKIN